MPEIQVKKGEPIDRALKRLKSKIETESILEEALFQGADLSPEIIHRKGADNAVYPTVITDCRLKKADFTEVRAESIIVNKCNMAGVIADKAFLYVKAPFPVVPHGMFRIRKKTDSHDALF